MPKGLGLFKSAGGGGSTDAWLKTGNTGTDPNTDFIGTTDNEDLVFRTNDIEAARITNEKELIWGDGALVYQPYTTGIFGNPPQLTITTPNGDGVTGFVKVSGIILKNTNSDFNTNIRYNGSDNFTIVLPESVVENGILINTGSDPTTSQTEWQTIQTILASLPSYVDDAAAAIGGLAVGDSYFSTSTSSYTRRLV